MADGDRQLAFTTGPLPVSVQVSGADKLTPKTVNASFDGTGAGGPFLPCLIITGRTGHEVARIPGPQIAAGASAEVSWFPRVGGASSAGGTTDREILQSNVYTTIPGPGATWLTWDHFAGSSLLNLAVPMFPRIKTDGVYAITTLVGVTPMAVGDSYYHELAFASSFSPYTVQDGGPATALATQPYASCSMTLALRAGAQVLAYVNNYSAAAYDFGLQIAVVERIS